MLRILKKNRRTYPIWLIQRLGLWPLSYWRKNKLHKAFCLLITLVLLVVWTTFGIGQYYIAKEQAVPLTYGVTFVPDYASFLGLDPNKTMNALLSIGVKQFRLTSYWSDVEPTPGNYDFSQLDSEFAAANQAHAKIILTVGLRQPRWPECHPPTWVNTAKPMNQWEPALLSYMRAVISRYRNNPALQAYQLENEYFLQGFGSCNNDSRSRLVSEYQLIKKMDPNHPVIVPRSNNGLGFPINAPTPDVYSISVYRRVYNTKLVKGYLEYPFTPWFYAFLAGTQEIYQHRNMIIGEMQAEAWTPPQTGIPATSLKEQNKSITAARLNNRFKFSSQTGMKDVIMWGGEYWYYRMVKLHDPSLWNVAKQQFKASDGHDGSYFFSHLRSF